MSSLILEATCNADSWALLKILLFLYFHKFHNVKITKPLKHLLSYLAILVSASSHHDLNGRINCLLKCSQDRILLHTVLAKGQSKDKCSPVSRGPLHNAQCLWCGQPLFCRLSAVRIFFLLLGSRRTLCTCLQHGLSKWGHSGSPYRILWTGSL
jgi:hypothetical protein